MAILLTLAVDSGVDEAPAKEFASALAERLEIDVETQAGQEGAGWWAIAYLMEWSKSRHVPAEEVLLIGDRVYAALAELSGFRFGLLDWECEQFRTYEELAGGDLTWRGGFDGLVVERRLWREAGSPGVYVPFSPGYRWKPPDREFRWLGIRDLRETPGFDRAIAPVRPLVEGDGQDAVQIGLIRDRKSVVRVSDHAASRAIDLLPVVRHAAAREALLRLLPDGYWQPGLGRVLGESAAAVGSDYFRGGDAEHDIVTWHLVKLSDHRHREHDAVLSELIPLLNEPDLADARAWILRSLMSCNPTSHLAAEAARPWVEDNEVGTLAFDVYRLQGNFGLDRQFWNRYVNHPNAEIAKRAQEHLTWLEQRESRGEAS
jgi:hypothetical protein